MDLDSLKQYLMKLYSGSPLGQISQATAAGAQAAGVPAGATPLTDKFAAAGNTLANQASSALPEMPGVVRTGIDKTNSFLDMLHNKLFGGMGRGR